jgi:hypothetical protein
MRPHRTDGVSLGFGVIFLLVPLWWAVSQVVRMQLPAVGWLVAGTLILFGVVGLLGAIRSNRRTQEQPVAAQAVVEPPGDLPPELHADIVRELLDDPAGRFGREHPAQVEREQPAPVEREQPAPVEQDKPRPD